MSENYTVLSESLSRVLTKLVDVFENTYTEELLSIAENASKISAQMLESFSEILQHTAYNVQIPTEQLLDTLTRFEQSYQCSLEATLSQLLKIDFPTQMLLEHIEIHDSHVVFPEALIPEKLEYKEVPLSAPEKTSEIQSDIPSKRISLSDALSIISILVTILLWVLSEIRATRADTVKMPEQSIESVSSISEDQAQQIIDLLTTLSYQQQELIDFLESNATSVPVPHSEPSDIQFQIATSPSAQIAIHESNSINFHESDNSELHSEPEP